jgi:hypothetical protein
MARGQARWIGLNYVDEGESILKEFGWSFNGVICANAGTRAPKLSLRREQVQIDRTSTKNTRYDTSRTSDLRLRNPARS